MIIGDANKDGRVQLERASTMTGAVASRHLRIGQFTDSYPPIINGVSAFVSEHHQELLAQYQNSFVFTYGHVSDTAPEPGVYRTPAVPMGSLPFRVALTLDVPSRKAANTLDIFHVHEPFVIANVALALAQRRKKPLIYTNHTRHDTYTDNYPKMVRPPIRQLVTSTVEKAIRASTLSTAPSENTALWMRSLVPDIAERVIVMRNGIHLEHFEQVTDPVTRADFNIPADQTIIMYVGRLTPEKNLETFAAGFLDAVAHGAQVHWILIGEGKTREKLEEMLAPAQERVHFVGAVPRTLIPRFLMLADVFGTASLSEANPISVIEAMGCRKPYIGLACEWWNEFTQNQSGGLLAETPETIGSTIQQFSENRGLQRELGERAHAISHQFDIRNVTARWIEIYQSLVQR
jgi:1,2-diacylglycerol 3-alpha-glucosyltransferase